MPEEGLVPEKDAAATAISRGTMRSAARPSAASGRFRVPGFALLPAMPAAIFLLAARIPLAAQAQVSPVFATPVVPDANVDSPAVWVSPDARESLLFVTEKEGDRVQVWRAHDGERAARFLGGAVDGRKPGEFNRPNGVWVMYHVPHRGGFADILLVTDQRNERVQVFRLPDLEYFGEFGSGQIGKGYGLSPYQDGADFFVFVTDNIPTEEFPGKIKKYRLHPEGERIGGELVASFGSEGGNPPLPNVESILADFPLDRLHVCGDEGGDFNLIFRIDGTFTGTAYGESFFQSDQEGVNLYWTGDRQGYVIVSDQRRGDTPNEYEVFDRLSLAHLGHFRSALGGSLITTNTDGCYLEQRPLRGFPNGAFYAVNDDENVHAYDWTDIAEALGLEIVALDRPFPGLRRGDRLGAGRRAGRALWFQDGSWWAALSGADGLAMYRLEDGTFRKILDLGVRGLAATWSGSEGLALLVTDPDGIDPPSLRSFSYEASRRRYRALGKPLAVDGVSSDRVSFTRERDEGGAAGRGWIAWVEDGQLRVLSSSGTDLSGWDAASAPLGPTKSVAPSVVAWEGAIGVIWAEPDRLVLRLHRNGDPMADWSEKEVVALLDAESLSAASTPGGTIVAAASAASGSEGWAGRRSTAGQWTGRTLEGSAGEVAVVLDGVGDRVYLYSLAEVNGRRVLRQRHADLMTLSFNDDAEVLSWPGVSFHSLLYPEVASEPANNAVVVALGDDGWGYFARTPLERPDVSPPVTLQHFPPPDGEVANGTTLFFRIVDPASGVDRSSLRFFVNAQEIQPRIRGVARSYLVTYELTEGASEGVSIRIEARDRAVPPNVMVPFEYELRPGRRFRRGDANEDARCDVSDPIRILLHLFAGRPPPACSDSQDVNDDGSVDLSDAIWLMAYLFRQGAAPADPGDRCGLDLTADDLPCGLSPCDDV